MILSALRLRVAWVCLGLAPLSLLPLPSHAQVVLADSAAEFSGVHGQDDWWHGYRNLTLDSGANDYDAANDFIPFPGGEGLGAWDGASQFWTGTAWDLNTAAAQPWTFLGATATHPNGSNQPEVHWTIRRWTAPASDLSGPTLVQVDWHVAKTNAAGNGVSAQLHHNGTMVDKASIAGNDTVGVTRSTFLTADAGNHIDLAHTAEGPTGDTADGSDGSDNWMIISTVVDTDADQLADSWEEIYFPGDLTQLASGQDYDGDGLNDEDEFASGTDPTRTDGDGDGYSDLEEINEGSNPNNADSRPVALALADSRRDWSTAGTQGENGWNYGYRNFTADGGGIDYDSVADFIEFPRDAGPHSATNFWNGTQWDWFMGNEPWTEIGLEGTHPNGTNNSDEHWTVRRWSSGFDGSIRIIWHTRETNDGGSGVTGAVHLNGVALDSQATDNLTGFTRTVYANVATGDHLDLVLTPEGTDGNRSDGADGSANWMWVDDRVPPVAQQPDGKWFVPLGSPDTDADGIADAWEEIYFPGDLNALAGGNDYDGDDLDDDEEQDAGTDPTNFDTDADGLSDGEEVAIGSNPCRVDTDGDGLSDFEEVFGNPATDPTRSDSDGDGFDDPTELTEGSDPNDPDETPITGALADSLTQFSGVQGQDGWRWGYRNFSQDGGAADYDPVADFIEFAGGEGLGAWDGNDQHWTGTQWDLNTAAAGPWTALAAEATHPNGTNSAPNEEHWTVRRWVASGLGGETPVRITWHTRGNGVGDGTTGAIHVNGVEVDFATVNGTDAIGVRRVVYAHVDGGDFIDQVLTPQGVTNNADGSDTSYNWMRIDTRIPDVPVQPNGKYFIPNDAEDTDADGLADFWEEIFFPGDLSQLDSGGDFDGDGSTNAEELAAGTDPTNPDTDGDGLSDGDEVAAGTNPCEADTDGDSFGDFHEIATGYDPLDSLSNPSVEFLNLLADSLFDFPLGDPEPQDNPIYNGWTYGYYNVTQDGEPPANTNFIEFRTDGTTNPSTTNQWDGINFDFYDDAGNPTNPPWTSIGLEEGHPNGSNNVDVHWAVRRWTSTIAEPATLLMHYHLRKTNTGGGNGTTAVIMQNGNQLDSLTIAGNDGVGVTSWYFIDAAPGDLLEIALTPRGIDGLDGDGSDGSAFWMLVDTMITANPLQPDGTPFVPGGMVTSRLLDANYDLGTDSITLTWTSQAGKEYQVQHSPTGQDPWTNIGPTFAADPTGTNTETINGLGLAGPTQIFRILELDP